MFHCCCFFTAFCLVYFVLLSALRRSFSRLRCSFVLLFFFLIHELNLILHVFNGTSQEDSSKYGISRRGTRHIGVRFFSARLFSLCVWKADFDGFGEPERLSLRQSSLSAVPAGSVGSPFISPTCFLPYDNLPVMQWGVLSLFLSLFSFSLSLSPADSEMRQKKKKTLWALFLLILFSLSEKLCVSRWRRGRSRGTFGSGALWAYFLKRWGYK